MKPDENLNTASGIEFFTTTDLALAASLLCTGYDCNIDARDQVRAKFLFKNNRELEETVRKYWANELRVSPKEFSNSQRELKARIRESGG